ncbi:hypothetical protein BDZ94DRAFT_1168774, partial [Collybia nuda]
PFRVVDMVIEIQTERRKVTEAMNARDAVVQRLVDAYESIHEKTALIEHLQKQIQQEPRGDSPFPFKTGPGGEKLEASRAKDGISGLENAIKRLREERELLKERRLVPISDEPLDMVKMRNAILATLPLPKEVPEDTLSPLSIPATFTLQEFLSSILANYRLFYALTTLWCLDREEHGYFYAPVFKCSTNPRVATAHRWTPVDVIARMNKPTGRTFFLRDETCFYNKDGTWYYAGIYKAFLMDNLNVKEWAELPTETAQAIVKDTISARKNTSPQNVYEVTQLYAAGALKVACVGLQCVGFNNAMYKALLEQANKFALSKWKTISPAPPAIVGLGTGSIWNSTIGVPTPDIVDALGNMNLGRQGTDMNENIPLGKR